MCLVFIAVLLHLFQWGKELGQQHLFPGHTGREMHADETGNREQTRWGQRSTSLGVEWRAAQ